MLVSASLQSKLLPDAVNYGEISGAHNAAFSPKVKDPLERIEDWSSLFCAKLSKKYVFRQPAPVSSISFKNRKSKMLIVNTQLPLMDSEP